MAPGSLYMKAKMRGAKAPAKVVAAPARKLFKGIDRIGRKPNMARKQRVLPTVMKKPSKPVKRRRI